MASQRPSYPWGRPRSRPCGRTPPAQALSPGCFPPPGLLTPPLAAATGAPGTTVSLSTSRRDPSAPRPSQASAAASASLVDDRGITHEPPPADMLANGVRVVLQWAWALIPLGWGVWNTIQTSRALFQ